MLSKGDIVYYISYLGHKLERDDFAENKGVGDHRMQSSIFLLRAGKTRSQTLQPLSPAALSPASCHLFYPSSHKGARVTRGRSSSPVPRAPPPWLLQNPATGDVPRDLPYLAPRLSCFQGALSTSETEHLLLPHRVPRRWRNSVCQSSQDGSESQLHHLSLVTGFSGPFPTRQTWGSERTSLLTRPWCPEGPGRGVSAAGKVCPYLLKEGVICQALRFFWMSNYTFGERN